jgi:hypothetical protein
MHAPGLLSGRGHGQRVFGDEGREDLAGRRVGVVAVRGNGLIDARTGLASDREQGENHQAQGKDRHHGAILVEPSPHARTRAPAPENARTPEPRNPGFALGWAPISENFSSLSAARRLGCGRRAIDVPSTSDRGSAWHHRRPGASELTAASAADQSAIRAAHHGWVRTCRAGRPTRQAGARLGMQPSGASGVKAHWGSRAGAGRPSRTWSAWLP